MATLSLTEREIKTLIHRSHFSVIYGLIFLLLTPPLVTDLIKVLSIINSIFTILSRVRLFPLQTAVGLSCEEFFCILLETTEVVLYMKLCVKFLGRLSAGLNRQPIAL